MIKNWFFLFFALILISCNSHNKFRVTGQVANATNETLYMEHNGLLSTVVMDSVTLDSDGSFSFSAPQPAYPDFYRLRIGSQRIDFAIDSCEKITITANLKNFSRFYTVEGSQTNKDIFALKQSLSQVQEQVDALNPEMPTYQREKRIQLIEQALEVHKAKSRALILKNPRSSAAYYAIYQKLSSNYIFSPYVKSDKPYCGAVATAYNTFMPEYVRSKNLYNLVLDAIKTDRQQKNDATWKEIINNSSTGYIDISLKDIHGTTQKLSSLEGKVVLIDFSSFGMESSVA